MPGMTLEICEEGGGTVFKVGGRLMYESDSQTFREKFDEQIQQGRKWMVVDLSRVIGLSSTGLGILIWAHRNAREHGLGLRLAHLSEKVRAVLQITRLNSVFDISETVEEAVKKLQDNTRKKS